jgi:hypothetical protein
VSLDFERRVQPAGKRRHVAHGDGLCLAVCALRDHGHKTRRCLDVEAGLRLVHLYKAGVEQGGGDADGVGTGHRRGVLRFHDDEAELRVRVPGGHQQVDMPEDAAARFIQHEIAQGLVAGDPGPLVPQGVAGRGRNAADDDVADFALGMD